MGGILRCCLRVFLSGVFRGMKHFHCEGCFHVFHLLVNYGRILPKVNCNVYGGFHREFIVGIIF